VIDKIQDSKTHPRNLSLFLAYLPSFRRLGNSQNGKPTEEGKEMVLSVTLKDRSNVKYLIKSPTADTLDAARKEGISKQKVSSWDMEQSGTVLSVGESPLPLGVALKVSSDPTAKKD
jgi:hypothetical protein